MAKRAEQSLLGHGRASHWDKGVALGVRTHMAWGPQLRAAVARGGLLLPTLPDTEACHMGPLTLDHTIPVCKGSMLEENILWFSVCRPYYGLVHLKGITVQAASGAVLYRDCCLVHMT